MRELHPVVVISHIIHVVSHKYELFDTSIWSTIQGVILLVSAYLKMIEVPYSVLKKFMLPVVTFSQYLDDRISESVRGRQLIFYFQFHLEVMYL